MRRNQEVLFSIFNGQPGIMYTLSLQTLLDVDKFYYV